MAWFKEKLNYYFGDPYRTHISNGYHEEIYVRVTANKRLIMKESLGGRGGVIEAKTSAQYEHVTHGPGFVLIKSGDYLGFTITGEDRQVFVSIKCDERIIADNYAVHNNHSVIVDKDGYVKNAKMGELWTDTSGKYHGRT